MAACASREYYSAFDESPSPRVYGESAAAEGKAAFEAWLGTTFPLDTPGSDGHRGDRAVAVRLRPRRVLPARHRRRRAARRRPPAGMKAWRDAGPEARVGVCLEILDRLHAPRLRARQRRPAHQRPGVRDGVPGRRRPRARPGARGDRLRLGRDDADAAHGVVGEAGRGAPLRMEKTFTVVPRGRGAGDRLQHLPDLELLARPVRVAGHRQPGRREAAPVAPCCRSRSPCRSARRCWPRPASTRTSSRWRPRSPRTSWPSSLAVRPEVKLIDFTGGNAFGDWLEEQRPPGDGLHREGRRQHRRARLDRPTSRRCARTSRSRSRSTPARCARRRRTSTSPPTASRPTRARSPPPRWPPGSARPSTSCSATTRGRSSCSAAW